MIELADELYRTYGGPLHGFVLRVAARWELPESQVDAEGVVHEAFMALLRSDKAIHHPPAWLCTVARRLVGKIARERDQRAEGDPGELLQGGAARWASVIPVATAEDIHEARKVLEDMATLPHHQKVAVYLHTVHGWTHAEIAEYLHCAKATVGVHVHRGISRLRKASRIAIVVAVMGGAAALAWWWVRKPNSPSPTCGEPSLPACPPPPPAASPNPILYALSPSGLIVGLLVGLAMLAVAGGAGYRSRR